MHLIRLARSLPLVTLAYTMALLCLGFALYNLYDGQRAEFWPIVDGKVVHLIQAQQGDNSGQNMGYRGKAELMRVEGYRVVYDYTLLGQHYQGRAPLPRAGHPSAGDSIPVYYNPKAHGDSRLDNRIGWHMVYFWLGIALLFAVVGSLWLRYIIRTSRRGGSPLSLGSDE